MVTTVASRNVLSFVRVGRSSSLGEQITTWADQSPQSKG